MRSGATPALEALAEQSGALLATSLLGKGLFDGNPYALDIAGAFASDFARERFAEADLVIGVGAGLGHYTTEGGYLYPGARVVQIDINPRGLWQGLRTADLHVRADAKAAAEAHRSTACRQRGITRTGFRTADMAQQIAGDAPDRKEFPVQANTGRSAQGDPRARPRDPEGLGHRGRRRPLLQHRHDPHAAAGRPSKYHVINDFGAIGSGAAGGDRRRRGARRRQGAADRRRRQPADARPGAGDDPPPGHPHADLRSINDGGYGAEFHKFRANGVDPPSAIHGRGDSPASPRASACAARRSRSSAASTALFREHQARQHGDALGHPHRRPDPVAQPIAACTTARRNGSARLRRQQVEPAQQRALLLHGAAPSRRDRPGRRAASAAGPCGRGTSGARGPARRRGRRRPARATTAGSMPARADQPAGTVDDDVEALLAHASARRGSAWRARR